MEKIVKINRGYEDLQVWQKAITLAEKVYLCTADFPVQDKYGLTSQVRRSAISIASNIAEGSARNGTKEFMQFIGIALGSVAELKTQIYIALRINYPSNDSLNQLLDHASEVERMLNGLLRSL